MPPGFDADQFVLGEVGPMVRGLFPASKQQVMLDLFTTSLVFVTHDNVEQFLRLLQQTKGPAHRRRLHAECVENWVPDCYGLDQTEIVDIVAEAMGTRNGWKSILGRCSPSS